VLRVVRELEQHVAADGWEGPVRLFALVRTAGAVAADPALASQLPPEVLAAAAADSEHLTAVEQENLPQADSLEALLGQVAWPDSVDGAAVVVERVVLSRAAEQEVDATAREQELTQDEAELLITKHPGRRDVRLAAAALRDRTSGCAVRARDHDSDELVAVGADLVPALVAALLETLEVTFDG
jgi:hypothetical protein